MRPLVPVLLAFISGVILSGRLGITGKAAYAAFAASIALLLFSYLVRLRFSRLLSAVPFFFLGALFIIPHLRPELPANHIRNLILNAPSPPASFQLGADVIGVVASMPEASGDRLRLRVEAKRVFLDNRWVDTEGAILLTVDGGPAGQIDIKSGDRVRFLSVLREPWNYGNPGEFDYRGWLNMQGIYVTGFVKDKSLIIKTDGADSGPGGFIERLRYGVKAFIDRSEVRNREPLKALIIASKQGIDPGLREAFAKTGTAHILAISGLHVGIVALFSYNLFIFIFKRSERAMLALNIKKASAVLTLLPIAAYGALAGFPVSAERAVIMAIAFVLTFAAGRGRDFLNTLALAALIILIITPYALWDVSFQLTFAAVAAIVYLVPRFEAFFTGAKEPIPVKESGVLYIIKRVWQRRVKPAMLITLSASLGTAPILAYHFHRVSLAGLAANLIVVPLTGFVIPLLLISSLILPLWEGFAGIILHAADAVFDGIAWAVNLLASLPYSSAWVTTPTLFEIFLFYAIIISLTNVKRGRRYVYMAAILSVALSVNWGWWNYHATRSNLLKVTFLSVGQGDSALVEFPGGKTMLIDGGGQYNTGFDRGEKVIAPFLWHKKISRIDYMVLSHAQLDHMGGLKFIAENFGVREFWWNGVGELGKLGEALSNGDIKVKIIGAASGRLTVNGVNIEPIHPFQSFKDAAPNINDSSLVLRLVYGERSFLFTGDIGEAAERELIKRDIRSTVLKSAHHGSRNSSSSVFLDGVKPAIVVISAGRNNVFGFPHRETLGRYSSMGAKVFRTDSDGAVTISTDGKGIEVNAYLTGGGL